MAPKAKFARTVKSTNSESRAIEDVDYEGFSRTMQTLVNLIELAGIEVKVVSLVNKTTKEPFTVISSETLDSVIEQFS